MPTNVVSLQHSPNDYQVKSFSSIKLDQESVIILYGSCVFFDTAHEN